MDAKKADSVQTTISIGDLTECLKAQFPDKVPSDKLVAALFKRFRPLEVRRDKDGAG